MKTKPLCNSLGSRAVLLATAALSLGSVWAQAPDYEYNYNGYPPPGYGPAPAYPPQGYAPPPSYAPPPYYEEHELNPRQLIPEIRRRFSETFRRLFYGDHDYEGPLPGERGRSLDEPPPYSSHYDGPSTGVNVPPQYAPRTGREAYRYEQPPVQSPRYRNEVEAPRYQGAPEAPRYQSPPPNRYQPPAPSSEPSSKARAETPSKKPSTSSKKKVESSPPKNYTPPTITRKSPNQPKQSPPSSPAETDYSFSPETKPSKADTPPASKSSSGSKTASSSSSTPGASKSSAGTASSGSFLRGKRTAKPGRVTSPYPPYQELDVTGLASGSLALDPTTQKVFEVP